MRIKKLVSNIVFIKRPETENKWWHRLSQVLVFGSGIIVFIISILFSLDYLGNHRYVAYHPTAFSLEPNYERAKGKEFRCEETLNFSGEERFIIKCEGIAISPEASKRYQILYNVADKDLEKQFGLDKYDATHCSNSEKFTTEAMDCIWQAVEDKQADAAYDEYLEAQKNIARIKVVKDIHYKYILSDVCMFLLVPIVSFIAWILLWNSVIYRVILYIIYGKKK